MKSTFRLVASIFFLHALLFALVENSFAWADTPEAQYDKFMTDYMNRLKAVKAEKDDKKAANMIRQMKTEFLPRAEKLMPEVTTWMKSLSKAETEAVKKRFENKPWVKELIQFGFDANFAQRIEKSPDMKQAMEELQGVFKKFDIRDSDLEETQEEDEGTEEGSEEDNGGR